MGKILYNRYVVALLLLFSVVLEGCVERELLERPADGMLRINLEWPSGQSVAGGRIWLYGSDGSLYSAVECAAEGYECRVPADTYTVLVANNDCSNADCHDPETWQTCRMKAGHDVAESNLLENVGKVFCIGADGVTVKHSNIPTEVTLYPKNTVKKIHFEIDPNNIPNIIGMNLRMTGVIPSVRLMDARDAGETTGMVMAQAENETDGLWSADISVFGWRGENSVVLTLTYADGSTEETLPQDIGGQLAQLPEEGGTVYITLALPDGGEIGLMVTVKVWESGTGSGTVI